MNERLIKHYIVGKHLNNTQQNWNDLIKKYKNKIIGTLILIINIIWTGDWIWLFYGYHYSGKLYLFMYPDWILILNTIFGLIGILIGTKLMKGRIIIKTALLIEIPKFIVGFWILF